MNLTLLLAVLVGWVGPGVLADTEPLTDLKPATVNAFRDYILDVEAQTDQRVKGKKPFLWLDELRERRARVQRGEVVTERTVGTNPRKVPDGLVHDWIGAVFIPGVKLTQVLAFVQDYNHHKDFYGPEVMDARIISRDGEHFVLYMRLRKHKIITVVLDTWHDAQFYRLDGARWHSRSRTTKIAELENPGTPQEREKPAGDEHGFMWNLNSYWRFLERDGGVYVECQAVSLSRGIPWLVSPFIGPIVNDLPKDSLENTLTATRDGVLAQQKKGQPLPKGTR